jgi:drug/metabolite transporter (DMT)-like permease
VLDKAPRTRLNGINAGPVAGGKREELGVSTYAGQLESASTLPAERVLERRLTRYLIAIGGVLAGVGACVLVATSDHLVDPLAYGLLLADVIIGTVAVAIYWLVRRPGSRMALILLVLAAAFVGVSLQGAASPLLHSIGVLFDRRHLHAGVLRGLRLPTRPACQPS